jgi:superkiller protein 3
LFARGAEAHRVRDLDAAVSLYESALRADPAYFDVQYNLGLAQYQRGDWMASARAYERALALNPSSSQARYNFSLALDQGGFFGDAARELEKLLVMHPREVQARLALANLYANELRSPKLARAHYEKVLQESPEHPKAIEIRYWLRANP